MISPDSIADWGKPADEPKPLFRSVRKESREIESRELGEAIKRMTKRPS